MSRKCGKKAICLILTAALAFTMALPASGFAASSATANSQTFSSVAAPKASVSDEAELINAILNASQGETIQIQKSIQLTKSLEIPEGKDITLSGTSSSIKLTINLSEAGYKRAQQSYTEALLMVKGSLSLSSLTLDGESNMRVMYIGAGGNVTLGSGAVIAKGALGKDSINWGAGICMEGSRSQYAELTINNGAVIRDNQALGKYYVTGIGVCNSKYGKITMNGGTISGNKDLTTGSSRYFSYGGGIALDGTGASLIMNGGTISNNSAKAAGGGVYAAAGKDGFTMNGGVISGNSTVASGGGLYVGGVSAVMNNGTISGNTAQSDTDQTDYACGGGVYIAGDSAQEGSGSAHGTFTMKNGTISGNTAKTIASQNRYKAQFGQGGGVMAAGVFCMEGGSISGNSALSASELGDDTGCGGGVSIKGGTAAGSFLMTGGSLNSNKASNHGGAVYMNNKDLEGNLLYPSLAAVEPYLGTGLFSLKGTLTFIGNTAADSPNGIYLTKGAALKIAGPLASGSEISLDTQATERETIVAAADGYTITEADAGLIKSGAGENIYGLKDGAIVLTQGTEPGTDSEPENETDITKAKISNIKTSYTYTGKKIQPAPIVELNGEVLKEDQDYVLDYDGTGVSSRKLIDVGTKSLVITGTGKYQGEQELTYNIMPASISQAKVAAIKDQIYGGKACTPSPSSVTCSGIALLKSKDYTLTYSANKKPGKASVKLTGKGDFTGTKTVTFRILPAKAAIKSVKSGKKGQASITWGKVTGASGYEIVTAYNSKFTQSKKTISVKGQKVKAAASKLKSGKTCYVKVRAYTTISGKKCWGAYSSVKKATIK